MSVVSRARRARKLQRDAGERSDEGELLVMMHLIGTSGIGLLRMNFWCSFRMRFVSLCIYVLSPFVRFFWVKLVKVIRYDARIKEVICTKWKPRSIRKLPQGTCTRSALGHANIKEKITMFCSLDSLAKWIVSLLRKFFRRLSNWSRTLVNWNFSILFQVRANSADELVQLFPQPSNSKWMAMTVPHHGVTGSCSLLRYILTEHGHSSTAYRLLWQADLHMEIPCLITWLMTVVVVRRWQRWR